MKNPDPLDLAFIRVYREQARVEQNSQCEYCFERLSYNTATADHVKAQSKNGSDRKENIVAACSPCNSAKGSMSVGNFKNLIKSNEIPRGKHWTILLAWSRRRINLALNRLEKKVLG